MEPVLFVMAILGCADDGGECRQQRMETMRYASAAACQAAVPDALQRNADLDYPVIGAECQQIGARMAADDRQSVRPSGG